MQIAGWSCQACLHSVLQRALSTAHKIQNPIFCARSTARVNAMLEKWWPIPPGEPLDALVEAFTRNPQAPRFAVRYTIGEDFRYRQSVNQETMIDLPYELKTAKTLRDLAYALNLHVDRLLALNYEAGWDADANLLTTPPTVVNLPDPEFAPLLAARLSAEILTAPLHSERKRILIQKLVPVASSDPTSLDVVLSRLVIAAQPTQTGRKELYLKL
jgi:hypothetical protein